MAIEANRQRSKKVALPIRNVSESELLEELHLKLVAMELFANDHYNEIAKEGCATVFRELKSWIKNKRLHSH